MGERAKASFRRGGWRRKKQAEVVPRFLKCEEKYRFAGKGGTGGF
jgi:hypothetical protein